MLYRYDQPLQAPPTRLVLRNMLDVPGPSQQQRGGRFAEACSVLLNLALKTSDIAPIRSSFSSEIYKCFLNILNIVGNVFSNRPTETSKNTTQSPQLS